MDLEQWLIAVNRYHSRFCGDAYRQVTGGLDQAHATRLGCAVQDMAMYLCGYTMPDHVKSIRLIRRESKKRRRLAAQFLRRFKGAI